jgi:hypothetical protein
MQKVAEKRRKKLQKNSWQVVELRVSNNPRNSLVINGLRGRGPPRHVTPWYSVTYNT